MVNVGDDGDVAQILNHGSYRLEGKRAIIPVPRWPVYQKLLIFEH